MWRLVVDAAVDSAGIDVAAGPLLDQIMEPLDAEATWDASTFPWCNAVDMEAEVYLFSGGWAQLRLYVRAKNGKSLSCMYSDN